MEKEKIILDCCWCGLWSCFCVSVCVRLNQWLISHSPSQATRQHKLWRQQLGELSKKYLRNLTNPLSPLMSGKQSLEVKCNMTICNTFHHSFSKPSLTPRLDLPNMAPARAIQLFIRIIDQIKVKFIFLAGSITILLQPLLNLVNWPHNDCDTT